MTQAARSGRATSRTNDPAGVRGRLLDAAAALFQNQGYHGTSMDDVRKTAGVSAGAMHHHYPTKKALGLATIRDRIGPEVGATWIDPVVAARSARDGVRKVMDAIHADLAGRSGVKGCPLNNLALELALVDDDFRAEIDRIFTAWQKAIAAKIADDRARGRPASARDPDNLAAFIVAAYSGAMAMAKARQDPEPLRRCRDELLEILRG